MKFRKKAVEVEAWPVNDLLLRVMNGRSLPDPVDAALAKGILKFGNGGVHIKTLEGGMYGPAEWMLIRGVEGEFYACKPTVFNETYEPA